MTSFNSDFHCHPSLKPFWEKHARPSAPSNIWKYYPANGAALRQLHGAIKPIIRPLARDSQSNLEKSFDGDVRLLFFAIYPIEVPLLTIKPRKRFARFINEVLPRSKHVTLGEAVVGIPRSAIQKLLKQSQSKTGVDYFKLYKAELDFVLNPANETSPDLTKRFQVAADHTQMNALLGDPKSIAGVITVEGAHSFGNYAFENPFDHEYEFFKEKVPEDVERLRQSFHANIAEIKSNSDKRKVPFFVTFCHHFNNLLAGHSPSLSDSTPLSHAPGLLGIGGLVIPGINRTEIPGMRHFFDQRPGMNRGFTPLGIEVLHLLLSRMNGRRILIDTKHMSIQTRREFYDILDHHYIGDDIPIVHSHGSANGWFDLDEAGRKFSNWELDDGRFFSRWPINLTDEDIERTFRSDGIIGVCLHEGRMPGLKFKMRKRKLIKSGKTHKIKRMFLRLFLSNVFHIVKVQSDLNQREGLGKDPWSGITLGSDYDGIVDAFDEYEQLKNYTQLKKDLIQYVNAGGLILDIRTEKKLTIVNNLLGGKSIADRIEQVFSSNVLKFTEKFFNDEYLEDSED